MAVKIRPAESDDGPAWRTLWRGYCEFYGADIGDDVTRATWARILDPEAPVLGYVACLDGTVVGFANAVLHPNTWSMRAVCYLEDLFVGPAARGRGAARALIEALAVRGRADGWLRIYWMTHDDNAPARALYDSIAPVTNWVRYDLPLAAPGAGGNP